MRVSGCGVSRYAYCTDNNAAKDTEGQNGGMDQCRSLSEEFDRRGDEPEQSRYGEARVEAAQVKKEHCDGITEPAWRPTPEEHEEDVVQDSKEDFVAS